jgi:CHAD domain-containing protein
VVAVQLARIRAADPGTRVGRDAEAVHEQRVAVRRLRAALRTFAAGVPPRLQSMLRSELRWLGQELGAVRDFDVQLANLDWHVRHLDRAGQQRLEAFRRHLESERTVRRAALVAALDSRRYFRLLAALERFAASPVPRRAHGDAARPVAAVGRRAIKRAVRRLLEHGDAIGEVPKADDLHRLRIRAKRLRYLLESLRPITGSPGRKLIRQLVRLQDVLGRFNDAMVAAAFVRSYRDGPAATADDETRHALAALADVELRRAGAAQSEFARAWRRFTAKSTLRLRRSLLKQLKVAGAAARPPRTP